MAIGNFFYLTLLFLRLKETKEHRCPRLKRIMIAVGRLRLALFLIVMSLLTGTMGYVVIENYPWFDAFYMSVITLASVGFGEVHPLSTAGRLFTSGLILFNVGTFAYAISILTSTVAEGGFAKLINDLRMNRKIENLKGHTIVCGFGRHATEVAQELHKQKVPFVVVENKFDKLDLLRKETPFLYVEGDATQEDVLEEAGIQRAASLVITLPSDADNLFITLTARQINPSLRIISRASNHCDERKIIRAGANQTVVPERIGGFYMANWVNNSKMLDFYTLLSEIGPGNMVFDEVELDQLNDAYVDLSLGESQLKSTTRVSIIALRSPNGHYELNPDDDKKLKKGWKLVILGNKEQIEHFKRLTLSSANT